MAETITIKVKLFSHLKYALQKSELAIECHEGSDAGTLAAKIREMGGAAVADIPFRIAVNQNFVDETQVLQEGDEVALIPPVQGG